MDFKDRDGKRYVFSKKNYEKHALRHPELKEPGYLKTIKELIINCQPDFIYPSYDNKKRFVYYEIHAKVGHIEWYNQVVIERSKKLYIIITAYRFGGLIREKKYGGPLCQRP